MREYITPDDICNQISMNRSVFKGVIILSEGKTDQRLYGKFADHENARVIPAHSKDNVRNVITKMDARRDGKVMGIVDRDLDDLRGRSVSPPLFYTDNRDLEMMLINSEAFDDILSEYGDPDRIRRFEKQFGTVRDAVISAAYPLGVLMYISVIRGYNLNFRNLNFRDFIDRKSLSVDRQKLIQSVIANTSGCEVSRKEVLRDLSVQEKKYPDKIAIARGHDSVDVLLIGLKETFGAYNSYSLTEGGLGGSLRLAYQLSDFSRTSLYNETRKWADARNIRIWRITRQEDPLS